MRRHLDDNARPFRVLAPDPNYLLSPGLPSPPRAPEPYKVAPSTRAHRRSSFVIIAESRAATPESRSPSPTLPTGRVSPFRGRGFKGPPPRARSRPQSPDLRDRRRIDRRASVSQQSSPRRSLIPQPTRQRSTSLTKSTDRISSPKIGRRVDSRTRLNVPDSRSRLSGGNGNSNSVRNLVNRRPSTRASSKLSPIQGTPTKPEKNVTQPAKRDRARDTTRSSPTKGQKVTTSPTKNVGNARNVQNGRRANQEKSTEKTSSGDRFGSPSKIPLKANRNVTNSLNPARFITISNQPQKNDAKVNGSKDTKTEEVDNAKETPSSQGGDKNPEKTDLDLIDLLKQSSGATGTSSVVNTTATTAVQPLHIDANAILVDKETSGTVESRTEGNQADRPEANVKSSNTASDPPAKQTQNVEQTSEDRTSNQTSKPSKPIAGSRTRLSESRNESPVPERTSSHGKTASVGQSVKNFGRTNTSSDSISVGQRPKNPNATEESQNTVQRTTNVSSQVAETNVQPGETTTKAAGKPAATSNPAKPPPGSSSTSDHPNPAKPPPTETKSSSTPTPQSMNTASAVNQVDSTQENVDPGTKMNAETRGSASTSVSIESVGSTDTGVSVNTVRGVSSPREKTVHVMRRREIETLSGNVHVENGEPAVLAGANGIGDQVPERLLTRWKRSLGRYRHWCPSMRCLACRTDPKRVPWPGNQQRTTVPTTEPVQVANTAVEAPGGCWSKFKKGCRCNRLRNVKCCARKARVGPAEATVCCPPERRFGVICRRLFDRCKCKRAEVDRTRNIRAKHSLTSVAPPPLSEEPKAKIPDVLVEHNSLMRGAIPCLPVPLAWFCLVWNVLLPGSGTVWSGLFNLCTGQPRFSQVAGLKSRLGSFVVNLVVGVGQLFTVLFCLVGWGWSIWWGVTLVRLARKYKRFKASEAALNDPEARGGEAPPLPPGVPSHALRGIERAR